MVGLLRCRENMGTHREPPNCDDLRARLRVIPQIQDPRSWGGKLWWWWFSRWNHANKEGQWWLEPPLSSVVEATKQPSPQSFLGELEPPQDAQSRNPHWLPIEENQVAQQ